MEYETKLGKQLHSYATGTRHKLMAFFIIALIIFFVAMTFLLLFFHELMDYDLSLQADRLERLISIALFVTAAIILAGWAWAWLRIKSVFIHENGIVIGKGDYAQELLFSEIKGVLAVAWTKIQITHGPSPNVAFTAGKTNKITIALHNDDTPLVFRVPRFKHFARAINTAFTQYVTKGLNSGNIHLANISFGEFLRLTDGIFHYEPPIGGVKLGYSDILGLDFTTASFKFMALWGRNERIAIPYGQATKLLNIDILYYIIKKMPGAVLYTPGPGGTR